MRCNYTYFSEPAYFFFFSSLQLSSQAKCFLLFSLQHRQGAFVGQIGKREGGEKSHKSTREGRKKRAIIIHQPPPSFSAFLPVSSAICARGNSSSSSSSSSPSSATAASSSLQKKALTENCFLSFFSSQRKRRGFFSLSYGLSLN